MHLNPTKCSFGMQTSKFRSFMLTMSVIEEKLDKCQVIIDLRSPSNVKEV